MANKSKKPAWASVKTRLQQMDPRALVNLLGDIYRSSAENRRFLHARLLDSQMELAEYRNLVVDAVYPDPLSQDPVRVSEAKRLIRHYRQATSDIEGTVDLMLSFAEAGTDQAADLGYGEERYFRALEKALDGVADALAELSPDSRRHAVARIHEIAVRAKSIGWGYCDYTQEIANRMNAAVSSPTAVNRSGARTNKGIQPTR